MRASIALAAGLCWAAVALADSGWTAYGDIHAVAAEASGRFTVGLRLDPKPAGCGDGTHFYAGAGGPGADRMFQALSTALVAGKRIRLLLSGTCDINGYAEFTAIGIAP